eukprot:GHVN01079745.1.p1 GENE.GHVN01079745.1~~GHVN01079745.1.p1  ORF type:complete len:279 (-),score=70.96 GHVN01079745.1:180-1016(-)
MSDYSTSRQKPQQRNTPLDSPNSISSFPLMAFTSFLLSSLFLLAYLNHPGSLSNFITTSPTLTSASRSESPEDKKSTPVTYGSLIEIRHKATSNKLTSPKISWGSGSGQQAVTASDEEFSRSALWLVKEAHGLPPIGAGEPVECGAVIRLEHGKSNKNLHAHQHKAPISKNYEVSVFADGTEAQGEGEGDGGDNWRVECAASEVSAKTGKAGKGVWMKNKGVGLRHIDLNGVLFADSSTKFTQSNCPRCPIIGHLEVSVERGSGKKEDPKGMWIGGGE